MSAAAGETFSKDSHPGWVRRYESLKTIVSFLIDFIKFSANFCLKGCVKLALAAIESLTPDLETLFETLCNVSKRFRESSVRLSLVSDSSFTQPSRKKFALQIIV